MRPAVDPLMIPIRLASIAVSAACWSAHFIIRRIRHA